MLRLGFAFAVVSWLLVGVGRADAPQSDRQKSADALFEEGRKLLTENDAAGACAKFGEAIQLDPDAAGTMLNLGLCNEKLGKYKTALYWFRKAQVRATETGHLEHEKAAIDHTTDLVTKVATIKIAFSAPPPDATKVKIDGEDVQAADYLHAEVDPGHHALDAGAPGRKIVHQEFDVVGKGGQTLTITLVEGDNTIVIDRGESRRTAALYLVIGGGVLWLASGALSTYEKIQYDKCASDGKILPMAQLTNCGDNTAATATKMANDAQTRTADWGTSLFVAGAVAIGAGVYLYLTAPKQERVDRTVLVPSLGPDRVGFALTGGF